MSKPFNMQLFLSGRLVGSHSTRKRHVTQASKMQEAIAVRWGLRSPWSWKAKHFHWFLTREISHHAPATQYYYRLTAKLICERLGKTEDWKNLAVNLSIDKPVKRGQNTLGRKPGVSQNRTEPAEAPQKPAPKISPLNCIG